MTLKQYYQPDSKAQAAYPIPIPVPAPRARRAGPVWPGIPSASLSAPSHSAGIRSSACPAVVIQAPPDKTGVVAKTAACCGIGALFAGLCMLCTEYCVCDAMFYA
ncbi:hypothetical protein CcaverHIS002_0606400 [Cutaneotrichosporon cavernicola]|nr:hypothetical protein CcaverHIS002_0606400 [Cutaneotrichosporon cavernicola]